MAPHDVNAKIRWLLMVLLRSTMSISNVNRVEASVVAVAMAMVVAAMNTTTTGKLTSTRG